MENNNKIRSDDNLQIIEWYTLWPGIAIVNIV